MSEAGSAVMGIGSSTGETRAEQAAAKAIASPLLETSMEGARGVLLSVAGPADMTLHEISVAASIVADHSDDDANIIFGAVVDEGLGDEMRVTVIAAGFEGERGSTGTYTSPRLSSEVTMPQPFDPDADSGGDGDDEVDIPGFVQG
jgi:cell division protein FtsZ